MKINLPVTNVETLLPEGEFIYWSTDRKGVIVEANQAFAKVSHYPREEMIGHAFGCAAGRRWRASGQRDRRNLASD